MTGLKSTQATQKPMLRVATYNIHKCVGTDRRRDPQRILDVLSEINADIVALQEADLRFGNREGLLDLGQLHDRLGLVPVPVKGADKNHGWHGNVVLVREAAVHNTHQIRLPGVEPRGALVVDLEAKAMSLRIIATHFGLLRRSRAQQVEAVMQAATDSGDRTVLLMGDLNEWRIGRRSGISGLASIFGDVSLFAPSYPSRYPLLALDRILCNPRELLRNILVHSTPLSRKASDHLPITAEVMLNLEKAVKKIGATILKGKAGTKPTLRSRLFGAG
jgi:endonuclease/exonuclease/phosphatase family metal-dependent hydrolase